MSVLYIDSKYGISGDMTLASLIDLGAEILILSIQNYRSFP